MAGEKKEVGETRSLIISDFRNIGVSALRKNKDERASLVINRSLKKDELGGLVILLGGNNSGKSNVLSALTKYTHQDFDENDRTDFVAAPKTPRLEMDVAGGKYGELKRPKILVGSGQCNVVGTVPDVLLYIFRQRESYELYYKQTEGTDEAVKDVRDYMNRIEWLVRTIYKNGTHEWGPTLGYVLRHRDGLLGEELAEIANVLENGNLSVYKDNLDVQVKGTPVDELVIVGFATDSSAKDVGKVPKYEFRDKLEEYYANQNPLKKLSKKVAQSIGKEKEYDPTDDVILTDLSGGVKDTEVIKDAFSKVYGYNLSDRVYRFEPTKIDNSDLTTDAKNTNDFIKRVFALLGYKNKSIVNKYYDKYEIRDKIEKELNAELVPITEMFNRLLNAKERKYEFHIRLEKEQIIFSVSYGEDIKLNINHQSDGFKWMFEFFFNFLMSNKFVAGDIVIIDEFGGLLNFVTVKELSNILRQFSRDSGITFVIATQNPMAVDIAHLYEVRMIVPRPDGGSDILNDFTEFGGDECSDALRPIISSMTVGRNFLRDGDRMTVFVFSYLEYFYLSAFSERLGFDIDFIPVNGITGTDSPDTVAKSLRSLEHDPYLLVSDEDYDQDFIEGLKKGKVNVYPVSEPFDGEFHRLNGLFAEVDHKRLKLDDETFDHIASISHSIPFDDEISNETDEKFKKLLNYIRMG